MLIYVGTFASAGGKGVVTCELTGNSISILDVEPSLPNPNYLILNKKRDRLYAVGGDSAFGWTAAAFALEDGLPRYQSGAQVGGADPCSLALSHNERYLYTANYGGANLSVLSIEDGVPQRRVQVIAHEGCGVNPVRQEKAHPHQVSLSPADSALLQLVDLGIDQVVSYRADEKTGLLERVSACAVPAGSGPRHLAYAKDGAVAYLAHEMGNQVSLMRYDGSAFHCIQTIPTLPDDFHGENSCAAIRVSDDGAKVYVSNRGHDSIAIFAVQSDDTLLPAGYIPAHGATPRDFRLLPDGRFLIANQDAGGVALVDAGGALIARAPVAGAVCIAF